MPSEAAQIIVDFEAAKASAQNLQALRTGNEWALLATGEASFQNGQLLDSQDAGSAAADAAQAEVSVGLATTQAHPDPTVAPHMTADSDAFIHEANFQRWRDFSSSASRAR